MNTLAAVTTNMKSPLDQCLFDPDALPSPDEVLFDGFLSRGDLVIWLGREKHRKTNVLLQFAFNACLGMNFLNLPFAAPRPLKVVFVDYESKSEKLRHRYDAICRAMGLSDAQKLMLKQNLHVFLVTKAHKAGIYMPRFPVRTGSSDEKAAMELWQQFVADHPADIYIFDPLRCMHVQDENDSTVELLLSRIRQVFQGAAVIVSHHMRKRGEQDVATALQDDMRLWSDGARGSGALKAHADVIVCQERKIDADSNAEIVHLGAFLKDGADIAPFPMMESDNESFFWEVSPEVPPRLLKVFEALKKAGGQFADKSSAAKVLEQAGVPRSTAFRYVKDLMVGGHIVGANGGLVLQSGARPKNAVP